MKRDTATVMRQRIRIARRLQEHVEKMHQGVYDGCPFYRVLLQKGIVDAHGNPQALD